MRLIILKFSKDRRDVDCDALAICPGCVAIQIDIFGGFLGRHTYLVAFLGLLRDVLKIALNLGHTLFVRDGAMSRHNCVHIHRENAIAGPQPVAGWPGPDDGMATNKQDIGCEDDPVSRYVDQGVAKCVSRPDLYKMDILAAYFQS